MPNIPRTLKDLPSPKEHWLKGSLGQFKPDEIHTYFYTHAKALGDMYKIRLLNKPVVVVSNAAVVFDILKQRPSRYRRAKSIALTYKNARIHGAFSSEGEQWRNYRQLLAPAFKPKYIARMLPIIQKSVMRFVAHIEQAPQPLDIQVPLQRLIVDITSELALGYDINSLSNPDNQLQDHLNIIFEHLSHANTPPAFYSRLVQPCPKTLAISLAYVRKNILSLIRTTKSQLTPEHAPNTILEALLLAKDEQGQTFSEDMIYRNIISLLSAGEDTTASTVAWAVYYLAKNPSVQQSLRNEITANYPQKGTLQWQDLENFPLTLGACQEALRLAPAIPFLLLEPLGDEVINGVYVSKGTTVAVLLASDNHNASLFKDSEQFHPNRWPAFTDEQKKQASIALSPFGGGPRLCPGMQLSLIKQKVILIELLKHYTLTLDSTVPVTSHYRLAAAPSHLKVKTAKVATTRVAPPLAIKTANALASKTHQTQALEHHADNQTPHAID
ncbi:cytochrome P450 [Marinagarivorans algicola]|uniref:cytochrome P450 n=1 Tax=Marinagarivorans algicola TaxID=1513270 RepID=UPI0006B52EB5|nr:cytochrome P450 [Marinagarivorans algicola]